jgi:hypothetical protein
MTQYAGGDIYKRIGDFNHESDWRWLRIVAVLDRKPSDCNNVRFRYLWAVDG